MRFSIEYEIMLDEVIYDSEKEREIKKERAREREGKRERVQEQNISCYLKDRPFHYGGYH